MLIDHRPLNIEKRKFRRKATKDEESSQESDKKMFSCKEKFEYRIEETHSYTEEQDSCIKEMAIIAIMVVMIPIPLGSTIIYLTLHEIFK